MTAYIKPTGWASESRYASGTYAGHPTKLRPSAATQLYGIQPQVRPAATELNYVMHSADALLAAFELHGLTNFRPAPVAMADTILGVHRPPLGGVVMITNASGANNVHYFTKGATSVATLPSTGSVESSVCSLTNAVYGGDTLDLLGLASKVAGRVQLWGTSKLWPHAWSLGPGIAGTLTHSLTSMGSGGLEMVWDEPHQALVLSTSTHVATIPLDGFDGGSTEMQLNVTAGSLGAVMPVSSPHGTVILIGTSKQIRSSDGGNTWIEGPQYGVDLIPPVGSGGETVSLWWSSIQDRWYLITRNSNGWDLWESTDNAATYAWVTNFDSDALSGFNVIGAGPNRNRAHHVRQFTVFPLGKVVGSETAMLILDESTLSVTLVPLGNDGIDWLGACSGSVYVQANGQLYSTAGSEVPRPLTKL